MLRLKIGSGGLTQTLYLTTRNNYTFALFRTIAADTRDYQYSVWHKNCLTNCARRSLENTSTDRVPTYDNLYLQSHIFVHNLDRTPNKAPLTRD